MDNELLDIKQASKFVSGYLNRKVSASNISYLIQYGLVKKVGENGTTQVVKQDLLNYFENSSHHKREQEWRDKLGADLNWALSFEQYREVETTKHVHRLHPYKGKFIPQLVEYFLDGHTDNFKKDIYFKEGDIVLDPFCGSGTTLVQGAELGIHIIGIDVSAFNSFISNVKLGRYDFDNLKIEINRITKLLTEFLINSETIKFENELSRELFLFNSKYFPSSDYRYKVKRGQIDEVAYSQDKENKFLPTYQKLIDKYNIKLKQKKIENFLDKWYLRDVRNEIDFVLTLVKQIKNPYSKMMAGMILSRTIRSCRATTHADLATLKEPVIAPYYCSKHGKVCKPLFSILDWWARYGADAISRLIEFNRLRTNTYQTCLTGDSRSIDILAELKKQEEPLAGLVKKKKINGIFSSPPYVGLIDYHEQHAYAYDLLGFARNDEAEIGPLSHGQGKEARESYTKGIIDVLNNCKKYLADDYDVFLVANDKYNLYPTIAQGAGMQIVNQFKRPVLNRTERDKAPYSEIIFHLKLKT